MNSPQVAVSRVPSVVAAKPPMSTLKLAPLALYVPVPEALTAPVAAIVPFRLLVPEEPNRTAPLTAVPFCESDNVMGSVVPARNALPQMIGPTTGPPAAPALQLVTVYVPLQLPLKFEPATTTVTMTSLEG